jgi:hypothetical protein
MNFFGWGEPGCFHCILCWNFKPGLFLVVSQLSGEPSSGNLWLAIDISQNCLNWTKAYIHFPSNASQVSPSVAHDQNVHSFGSFIVGGLFLPPRLLIIFNALPAPFKFSSLFFPSAIARGLLPEWIHKVFIDFLEGERFLTKVLNGGSYFNCLNLA